MGLISRKKIKERNKTIRGGLSNGIHMDKLIKTSLIASVVTIDGNMDKNEEAEEETNEASFLEKFLTCNNCFKWFDDKKESSEIANVNKMEL